MSSGLPSRSSGGIFDSLSIFSCDFPVRNRSVAVGPGATALTVMLRPHSSLAKMFVIVSTADLVAT
jgi:hypothetical protein